MLRPAEHPTKPSTVVVVMPAYNEAGCIAGVIQRWDQVLCTVLSGPDRLSFIVVNDGSTDGTESILDGVAQENRRLTVIQQENAGHGQAVIRGYAAAVQTEAGWVFQVDSDDQFSPEDFKKLWNERDRSKFILGHRKTRSDSPFRHFVSGIVRWMILVMFRVRIQDSNIPYRLIQREYLARLLNVLPRSVFAPNIFLSIMARRDGQNLLGIPVSHRRRDTGSVSIVRWKLLRVCLRSALELIAFRLTLHRRLRLLHRKISTSS